MAKVIRCPHCGRLVSSGASSCKYCGATLDGSTPVSPSAPTQPEPIDVPAVASDDSVPATTPKSDVIADVSQRFASGIASLKSKASNVMPASQPTSTPPTVPDVPEVPAHPTPQPPSVPKPQPKAEPQPGPEYDWELSEEYSENSKSNKSIIITIIVAVVLLVAGGITAALILRDSSTAKNNASENTTQSTEAASDSVSENIAEEPVFAEANPVKHYSINTVMSGYPIIVKLDITPDGIVTGRYAYESTLRNYGDKPSSWFTLEGTASGNELIMDVSHPDYGNIERMEVTLTEEGDKATLNGVTTSYNTSRYFFVGSTKEPVSYYEGD